VVDIDFQLLFNKPFYSGFNAGQVELQDSFQKVATRLFAQVHSQPTESKDAC